MPLYTHFKGCNARRTSPRLSVDAFRGGHPLPIQALQPSKMLA
jgi:hypothetical protein